MTHPAVLAAGPSTALQCRICGRQVQRTKSPIWYDAVDHTLDHHLTALRAYVRSRKPATEQIARMFRIIHAGGKVSPLTPPT